VGGSLILCDWFLWMGKRTRTHLPRSFLIPPPHPPAVPSPPPPRPLTPLQPTNKNFIARVLSQASPFLPLAGKYSCHLDVLADNILYIYTCGTLLYTHTVSLCTSVHLYACYDHTNILYTFTHTVHLCTHCTYVHTYYTSIHI
jgi:hypothetical protein